MTAWTEMTRIALGVVFALSSASKLRELDDLVQAIPTFGVPRRLAPAAAALVVGLEVALAVLLISGVGGWPANLLTCGVLGFFVGLLTWNGVRGQARACHCFGGSKDAPHPKRALVRTVLLFCAAALTGLTPFGDGAAPSLESALGAIGIVLLAYWALRVDELVQLMRTPQPAADRPRRISYKGAPLVPIDQMTGKGPVLERQ